MARRSNSKSDKNAYLEETTCGKAGGWALVGGWVHPFNYGHKLQIHNASICKFHGEEIYIYFHIPGRQREKKAETETKQKLEKVWSGKLLPRYLIEASLDNWCSERNQNTLKCNFQ